MNENTFINSFFFCINLLVSLFFSSNCCLLSHFEIIICILKSLTATLMYFFVEIQLKKENIESIFWVPGLGAQKGALVCQMA